jgi:hypothetical protein
MNRNTNVLPLFLFNCPHSVVTFSLSSPKHHVSDPKDAKLSIKYLMDSSSNTSDTEDSLCCDRREFAEAELLPRVPLFVRISSIKVCL